MKATEMSYGPASELPQGHFPCILLGKQLQIQMQKGGFGSPLEEWHTTCRIFNPLSLLLTLQFYYNVISNNSGAK